MNRQIDEKDEYLLNRLLDGDLDPEEAEALRERIRHEPVLLETFESLARLNKRLASRGADEPTINWPRFHDSVMRVIETESAARRTIRFPRWLRIGTPLTAAAAIILLITVYQIKTPESSTIKDLTDKTVALTSPLVEEAGKIIVRYHREYAEKADNTGTIRVSFGRSTEVAATVRKHEEDYLARPPSWQVLNVEISLPMPPSETMEVPPL
jgi:hypothetical protein